MESSNPTLSSKVFSDARVAGGAPAMTVQGAVNKTLALFVVLLATAFWTWSMAFNPSSQGAVGTLMTVGLIGGLIVALVTTFKRTWAPVTAPLYAAFEGVFLGAMSAILEAKYPGIVMQAVGLTFGVMMAMLLGYKAGIFQATPALRKGLMVAIFGLIIFYVAVMVAGFFGISAPGFISGSGPMGIAFSLFVVGLASLSLILDFDLIERGEQEGMAKYMEWYCGFALMVTLVWLYLELLRLMSKLNSRN